MSEEYSVPTFDLPPDRIATEPTKRREESKLFVYDRTSNEKHHATVRDIGKFLRAGDLLVLNDVSVEPARVYLKKESGGKVEALFLSPSKTPKRWDVLLGGKGVSRAKTLTDETGEIRFKISNDFGGGEFELESEVESSRIREWLRKVGTPPIPPYIRSERKRRGEEKASADLSTYRTDFSREKASDYGAVAAPTAGFHFSRSFLEELRAKGIETTFVWLAVGWGTFQPLSEENWKTGKLHSERVEISDETATALHQAREKSRRIIAVGTTVVRSIEWWAHLGAPKKRTSGECDLFLRPPWKSEWINGLVTNFHLPASSLLLLVAGFMGEEGTERLLSLYKEAIERNYRFYSYGDAMLIL